MKLCKIFQNQGIPELTIKAKYHIRPNYRTVRLGFS